MAAKLLIGKRDVDEVSRNITALEIEQVQKIDWEKIFKKDPFDCALSLVCQLAAGAERKDAEANMIYEFIS